MSKIVCEYDTKDKEMIVTVDGKVMDNVTSFSCYDEMGCNVTQFIEDDENEIRTYMSTSASESDEGKAAKLAGNMKNSVIDDYVTYPVKKSIVEEIRKYCLNKR